MKFLQSFFLIIIVLFSSNFLHAKNQKSDQEQINIVMDLGGVVLSSDKGKFLDHIGYWNGIKAWLSQDKMRKDMFELMSAVKPRNNENEKVTDERGLPLPQLMVDWLIGESQGSEILQLIENFIVEHPEECKKYNTSLLKTVMGVMFNDEAFVETQALFPEALAFVQRCKERGFNVYVLSNWPTPLELLQKKHAEFFNLCDDVVLSSLIHTLKPNASMYDYFIKQTGCNPTYTVLIDDQIDNVNGAKKAGWHGILSMKAYGEKPDFENIETALNKFVNSVKSKNKNSQKPLVVINQEA